MERSGSQKFLFVISIINIIFAVLAILAGFMGFVGGAMLGGIDSQEAASALAGSGVTQGQATAVVMLGSGVILISAIVELIMGILGIRAANDNQKIMPVWVFAIIEVVLYAVGLVITIVNGGVSSDILSSVISLLFGVLMLWVANNIKKQAGK